MLRPARSALLAALAVIGAAGIATAQPAAPPQAERTIRVSATGEVRATPDQAQVDVAVESAAASARAAGEANARQMERVIRALVAAGVPREEVETRGYNVFPEYEASEGQAPRVRGYRASNLVTVTTRELGRVGALIDAALGAGANRVDGVRFSLREPEAASNAALGRAVEQARRSAEAIAAALGVRLGAVLDASTTAEPPRPFPVMMRAEAADLAAKGVPTPIEPGEQTVSASISLVFAIAGAR